MATKQALREFQSRLADRLQAARSTGVAASWLAVEAGAGRYLFPLSHAGEIFPWSEVQNVPYVQPWFLGVGNFRGNVLGVIDCATLLDAQGNASRQVAVTAQSRLVSFNPVLEASCTLLVDRLLGLRTVEAFASSQPPGAGQPAYFGHVYQDIEGRTWQEINLQLLSQSPFFLNVGV